MGSNISLLSLFYASLPIYSCIIRTGFLTLSITPLLVLPRSLIEEEILLLAITIRS